MISKLKTPIDKIESYKIAFSQVTAVVFVIVFAGVGSYLLFDSHAATPPNVNAAIAPATNLQLTNVTPTQAFLTWTASTDTNVTSYAIYQGTTEVGTTDPLTTSFENTNLTPSSNLNYTVYALVNDSISQSSNQLIVNTPAATIPITSCGMTISSPGNYVLTGNLTASPTGCITIKNTTNVSLNCQNYSINETGIAPEIIDINGVNNFSVSNCNMFATTPNTIYESIYIANSNNGFVENNSLGNNQSVGSQVFLYAATQLVTGVQFINNTFYNGYIQDFSGNSDTFNHNTITCSGYKPGITTCPAGIVLSGSNNIVANNTINGEGSATPGSYTNWVGGDDGIVLGADGVTSNNNLIENNTLENFFDTGIETLDFVTNSTISNNIITNAAWSGVGGWWTNSWMGNTVSNNVVTNSSYLFYFNVYTGPPSGQTVNYFENNSFTGNSLIPGPYTVMGLSAIFSGGADTPTQYVAQNNIFSGNNFSTTVPSPNFIPSSMVVDGGDNVCGPAVKVLKCNLSSVPTPPANLAAGSDGSGSEFLSWLPSVDPGGSGIAGYNIFRGGNKLNATPVTATSYSDSTISTSGNYSYTVQAVDASGTSSKASNTVTISVTVSPPSVPTNVTAKANSASSVTVAWSSSTDNGGPGLAGYHILRNGQIVNSVQAGATSYIDTTASPNTTYSYSVEAFDIVSNASPPSQVAIVTTPVQVNNLKVNLIAPISGSTVSGSQVVLSAGTSDSNTITSVTFSVDGKQVGSPITKPSQSVTSLVFSTTWNTTSFPNGQHSLEAIALDSLGNSASSQEIVYTKNGDTTPPTAPTNLNAKANTPNQVFLTWTRSTDNVGVVGYYIVRNGVTIAKEPIPSSIITDVYNDETAKPSTAYKYYVFAYDAAGNLSANSNTVSITTPPLIDKIPPTWPSIGAGLTATPVSSNQINLHWNAASDNVAVTAYVIFRNNSSIPIATINAVLAGGINPTASYSWGNTGLTPSTIYYYSIKARDAAGNLSVASNLVLATTHNLNSSSNNVATIIGQVVTPSTSSPTTVISVGPGVTIRYVSGNTNHYTGTNASGDYGLINIPAMTYYFTFSKPGYITKSLSVTLNANQTILRNIVLLK